MLSQLKTIDKLEVIALMDNVSDPFTASHPGMRWNESQYRSSVLNKDEFCGADFCRACNGLSLYMKIYHDDQTTTLLFDAGPDEHLVVDNAERLAVDLKEVSAVVLSHGHFDHYGGILSVLKAIGKTNLPVYSHPELFEPRAFYKEKISRVSYNLTNADIERDGGKVIEAKEPLMFCNDRVLISGEVPRETEYETGSPAECRQVNGEWVKSPDVVDERVLIFNLKDKGLCVFTACGHTGVVNAAKYAKKITGIEDIYLLMGGFHLAPPGVHNRINPTLEDIEQLNPDYIVTGHCTGATAQAALSAKFPSQHISYGVGTVFNFDHKNE